MQLWTVTPVDGNHGMEFRIQTSRENTSSFQRFVLLSILREGTERFAYKVDNSDHSWRISQSGDVWLVMLSALPNHQTALSEFRIEKILLRLSHWQVTGQHQMYYWAISSNSFPMMICRRVLLEIARDWSWSTMMQRLYSTGKFNGWYISGISHKSSG